MKDFNKYKLLSEGKAFGDRAKIALLLLDSSTAYEELKDEGICQDVIALFFVNFMLYP